MATHPERLFLDTNIYIVGATDVHSQSGKILAWAGFRQSIRGPVTIIVSNELFAEILRVARRVRNKDWGGEILMQMWNDLNLQNVIVEKDEYQTIIEAHLLPREDIGVYLTARNGHAECFVSSNRKLIQALVRETGEFECLTPEQFVEKYVR